MAASRILDFILYFVLQKRLNSTEWFWFQINRTATTSVTFLNKSKMAASRYFVFIFQFLCYNAEHTKTNLNKIVLIRSRSDNIYKRYGSFNNPTWPSTSLKISISPNFTGWLTPDLISAYSSYVKFVENQPCS